MNDEERYPDELSPQEREAYRKLSREEDPGDLLEERVVRALKDRGLLKSRGRGAGTGEPRPGGTRPWKARWIVGAAAAALVLFLSGLILGQSMGARTATSTFLAIQEQESSPAADRVQAAGSEYVRALTRFAELSPGGSADQATQGRQAALGALLAATEILIRLEPDDPALTALLRVLEERRDRSPADSTGIRQVHWF